MSLKNGGFSSRPPATLFIKSPTQNLRELQRPRSPSPTVRGAQRGQPNSLGVHSTCNCVTTLSWVVALRRFVYTLHSTVVYYSFTYKYCTHNLLKFQQNTGLKGTSLKKGPP